MILHGLMSFGDDCMVMYATIMGVRESGRIDCPGEIITIGGESFLTKLTVPQVRALLLEEDQRMRSRADAMTTVAGGGH